MKLFKGAITSLSGEGRITLQVPEYVIGVDPSATNQIEELPDNWFVYLRSDQTPSVGRESGYLYLTRKGFEANRLDIQKAFIASPSDRTWEEFEEFAENHFQAVEKKTERKIKKLEKDLQELRKGSV